MEKSSKGTKQRPKKKENLKDYPFVKVGQKGQPSFCGTV